MTDSSIKFIATDMDRTLLDEQGQLDATFFDLHQQIEEKGILGSGPELLYRVNIDPKLNFINQ
ncbi:hypothetical protein GZ77_06410 [Endozoicomonas montiporae]|uniref:Haloacid dehalogenase n=1 Tax=Endozoicomonas montiporae TaxID=1027273 RepID=A0A081NCB8_9GAMM|nr:hypothetical protein GZ77_06410 [Endozoicomonas montiporae]